MDFTFKKQYGIQDLLMIAKQLREPDGCPWDKKQTHETMRKGLLEETYELAEAIDQKDQTLLCEELGDLLLHIVMHARIEEEVGSFTFEDVCNGICQKLIYRHPHVFAGEDAGTAEQVLQNWESLKNAEKGRATLADKLDSVPKTLPALMRSQKIQKRIDEYIFFEEDAQNTLEKLEAKVAELKIAIKQNQAANLEVGNVLFSAANVARILKIDAEQVLVQSADAFAKQAKKIEQLAKENGQMLEEISAEQFKMIWKTAKADLP